MGKHLAYSGVSASDLESVLLTWITFNPNMDKYNAQ